MLDVLKELEVFSNITYYDKEHKYIIDGYNGWVTSGTAFVGKFKEPFKADEIAAKTAAKRGITVEEVKHEWKASGVKGTRCHEYLENYLQNKVFPFPFQDTKDEMNGDLDIVYNPYQQIVPQLEKFTKDIRGKLIPVRSELVVGDMETKVCGMADQLFYNIKYDELQIWDWKTNGSVDSNSYGKNMKGVISHVPASKVDEYSLQLNLYKYIIEKNTNLKLGKCNIVWFNEKNINYEVIPCKEYQPEIELMMQSFKKLK